MSRFTCDACDDFVTGSPAAEMKFDPDMRSVSGDMYFEDGAGVEWPFEDTRIKLCSTCAVKAAGVVRLILGGDN